MKKALFFLGLATLSSCSYNLYTDGSFQTRGYSYTNPADIHSVDSNTKKNNSLTQIDISIYEDAQETYNLISTAYLSSPLKLDSISGDNFYYKSYIQPYSTKMILEERPNCWIYQNRSGDTFTRVFYKKGYRYKTYEISFDKMNQIRSVVILRENNLQDRILYTYDEYGVTKRELYLSNGFHLVEHYEFLGNGEVKKITINNKEDDKETPFLMAEFEYPAIDISTAK